MFAGKDSMLLTYKWSLTPLLGTRIAIYQIDTKGYNTKLYHIVKGSVSLMKME